jgi:hypothetical protein
MRIDPIIRSHSLVNYDRHNSKWSIFCLVTTHCEVVRSQSKRQDRSSLLDLGCWTTRTEHGA